MLAVCWCVLLLANAAAAQSVEWKTLMQEASTLSRQGQHDRAMVTAKYALELAEREAGPDHPSVATSLNNLAELYKNTGNTEEAQNFAAARGARSALREIVRA
jgi:Flp pilus assembly protein TadD